MAEKKSWRDYKSKSETEKGTKSGTTKSWRDYKSKTESVSENETGGTTSSLNSAGSWKDYNPAPAVGEKIVNRVNTWLNDHNTFISNYQNRYANRKYSYEDSYVSDSADWLNTVKEQKSRFYSEAESILSYMDQNKAYLDEDWVQSIKDKLVGAVEAQSQIVSAATQDNKWWSGFGTEELVNKYGTAEGAYKANQRYDGYAKKYKGKTYEDIQKALAALADGEEKDWLTYNQYDFYKVDSTYNSKAASGWKSYEAQKVAEQQKEDSKSFWENVAETFAYAPADTSLPAAALSNAAAVYRNDTTYREPNDNWSAEQKNHFGYLYSEDPSKAYAYAEQVNNQINAMAQYDQQQAVGNWTSQNVGTGILGTLGAIATAPLGMADFLDNIVEYSARGKITQKGVLTPFDLGQAAQSGVANSLNESYGTIDDDVFLFGGKGLGDVYSLGVSAANSLVSAYTLGGTGTLVNFIGQGGAAGVDDALSRGATAGQALLYGSIVGAAEGVTEMINADNLLKIGSSSTLKNYLLKALNQGIGESVEEGASSIIGNIADAIIMQDKSNFNATVNKYMESGLSEEEATKKAWIDMVGDVAFDALGGFVTGSTNAMTVGAVSTAWDSRKGNQKNIDAVKEYGGKTDALIQEGLESDVKSDSYKLATKYKAKTDSGKALTGFQIRNLLAANQEQITPKDLKKIQKAAEARLAELGQTEDVEKLAGLVTKYVTGQKMSKAEKAFLANNENGNQTAQEALPKNIYEKDIAIEWARENSGEDITEGADGELNTAWAEDIGTRKINADVYNRKAIRDLIDSIANMDNPAVYKSLEERVGKEDKLSVSKSGQATIRATDETIDLSKVEVADFVRDKDTGKVTDMILNVDGKQVKASEIDYADDNQSYLFSAVKNIENITPGDATVFVRGYDPSSGKTVGEYLNGIDEAYTYGYHKYSETDMGAGLFTPKLSSEQAKGAYLLGQTTRNKADANKSVAIKRMRTAVEAEAMKSTAEGKAAPKSKAMTITYNAGNGKIVDFNESGIELTDRNEAAVKVAQFLHRLGLGTNFEFFASELSDTMKVKDKKTGEEVAARVFVDEYGNEQLAPAGVYRLSDGTIRVDLNAYNGRQFALNALAHELTHFIQQWSDEKYKVLAEFLVNTYEKTGMTMHQRVLREQARLKEIRGEDVSYNEAYDEVVANAMGKMFDDGRLLARLTELKAKDESLARKLWEGIKEIVSKMLGVYKADPGLFDDAKDLWKLKEDFEKLQDIFAEALVEASYNFQAARLAAEADAVNSLGENAKVETNEAGELLLASNENGNVLMYSEQTYLNGGREKLETALRQNGHTEEEINETLSYVDDALDYIKILAAGYAKEMGYDALSNHLVADIVTNVKTGKQVMSAIVNNGDYPVNIDLSLICKKRVAYMNLMSRLIRDGVFDKVNYDGAAIAEVNEILRETGIFTEKDIEKYAKKADMTFKEIINAEVGNRANYNKTQAPKWESTVKAVEEKLQKNYAREQQSSQQTDIDTETDSAYDSANKETEQEDKTNVTREETREDFHRRAVQEGCTVNDRGEIAYAFRPISDWNLSESIRITERNLRKKGIQVIVCDLFEVNRNGITAQRMNAISAAGEAVYLHTAMETDPIETAEHEAYHFWKHTQARMVYFAELYKNFDFDSPAAIDLLDKIEKAYIESKKSNVEIDVEVDSDESVKLIEEAFAYVTGFAASGDQLGIAHKILRDFDAVRAAWDDLVKKQTKDAQYSSQETDADNAPTFYSQMGKVVEGMKQDKFGASSVISMLRGRGVKAEEIRWSGIHAFLDGKKSVTKAELIDFINSSMLQIEEERREKSNAHYEFVREWQRLVEYMDEEEILDGLNYVDTSMQPHLEELVDAGDLEQEEVDYLMELAHKAVNSKELPTKWDDYKLYGGDNYRELVFKMPGSDYSNNAMQAHWGNDAKGVLAHARIQDFDVDGKKMLFIEEIQSDWHNAGHKGGYQSDLQSKSEELRTLEAQLESLVQKYLEREKQHENFLSRYWEENLSEEEYTQEQESWFAEGKNYFAQKKELYEKIAKIKLDINTTAPDAPFKDNYHEYVLKRLLRMAAEQGYDSIGWTTAEIQSKRWSDDFAEGYRIEYDQDIPKFLKKYGKQWGAEVGKTPLPGLNSKETYYDINREETFDSFAVWQDTVRNTIDEQGGDQRNVLFGMDGSDWIAYDKHTGAEYDRATVSKTSDSVWSMDITDAMKKSVLKEGQAMYSSQETDMDTDGNQLTKEQSAFFAQSKLRDELGRLISMYHGTNNPYFTVFDPQYSDDLISLFFTSDPDVANTYTNAQDYGRDVDPYNLITKDSSAEQFNAAQEKLGGGLRVVKITPEWIAEMKRTASDKCSKLIIEAETYAALLEKSGNQKLQNHTDRIRRTTSKGAENLTASDISSIRSALFDASQAMSIYNRDAGIGKKAREQYKAVYDLLNVEHYVRAARTPESAIGKYTYTETNSMLPFAVETTGRGFTGDTFAGTESEAVARAIDRTKWVKEHSLGNRYKVYLNLTNPYIIDAGTDISGKMDHVYLSRRYSGDGWKIELESKDNDLTKYMTTDEFEAFVENAFDAKTTAKIKAQIEADNQAYQEEWGDLDPDYVDHNIELKDVNLTYIETGNWNSLNFNGMENARTRDVTAWAKDKGYDGVIFKNMKDAGGYAFTKGRGGSIVAVAFKPEQVKSVDNKKPTADKDIRYSTQETDNISNRDMLANAFETLSQNSDEYKMIQEYKGRVKILNEYEAKLAKLNAEIHKMMFDPDTERDAKKLKELQAKAKKVASDINRHDKKLLSMEASEPLRKVIEQERKKASQETRDHVKEIQKNKKARAEQTELRHKIRKAVRDLDKLLNRGNKKTNVKEDMKSFVSKALELADYIFTDHITNDELIRNGITVRMTAYEKKLVRETEDILNKLYDEADSLTDEEFARLDAKRKSNEDKLRDLLKAQRNERLSTPVYQLFNDLVTEYASLKNSSQDSVKAAYNEELENSLRAFISDDDRVKILKNMRVADMTAEELNWLYRAYTMVLTNVRNANKFHVKGMNESIEQVVGQIAGDFGSRKIPDKKLAIAVQKFVNKLGWDYEKLYYALDRIGSDAFTKLIMNIADSENTVMQDIMEAAAFRDKIVENYGFNNWDINKEIDREFLDNTGKKFKLTLGQLMSLYAYSRRDGAWDHIEYGGFVFGEAALTNPRPADSYKLSKEQCEAITSLLTKEQKGYVEDMQKFLSETMGAKGNEVSMILYGIKMFGEKNYFPIHIAGQFKAQANESQAKAAAGFSSMSNAGFTHAQNPNAKAPFVLEGFNEIWVDHVNEMSRYHGTVPALEDLRRVMNRSTYSDAVSESQSIKQLMENSYGKEAVDYFDNLYREANSGAITDKLQKPSQKLLSLFRKNSVAYSLSVIIQQPAAMVRAYDLIDKKYFGYKGFGALTSGVAKAVSSKWNPAYANAYNEMLKYAPGVTMAKEIGGFDTHTGGSIRSYLLDTKKSLKQKWKTGTAMEKGKAVLDLVDDNAVANLPNVADKIAWIEIWNACKRETLATHKNLAVNSEEFMQAVGDRFTEVIRATQVYDSMFAKSPMLKSKNIAVQYLVSFMNEPNTVANMAEKAVRDVTRGDWKKGLRTGVVVINSIIFTNMLKSIIYAMRDDDEDETYIEKYIEAITGNMMDDFWVPNYIPIARDVWSLAQGYDVERADMAIVSDALGAFNNVLKNAFTQTEDMTEEQLIELDKKQTEAGWQLVESLAAFLGIPVKNIRRDIEGILDHARIASANAGQTTAQSSRDKIYDAVVDWIPFMQNKNTKQDKLYDAIINGDKDYIDRIKSTYKTDDAYQSAVRKALRKNDPRIREAAQARYDGNTEEYKRIFREIQGEGKFTFNEIMGAVNAEENAIKNKLEPEKATSEYSASDYVEAVAMGYTSNAEAMKEDIIATKVANGKTQEEAEKEFISNVSTGIRDAYASGLLDEAGAKKMLMEYAGKDEEEAASRVSYWSFCEEHPEYDRLSESNVNDYREFAEPANIPLDVFDQYVQGTKGLADIKDKWGDVEVTKREQVLEVIDSLPLTRQQKDALYLAAGYSESKIWDVPW